MEAALSGYHLQIARGHADVALKIKTIMGLSLETEEAPTLPDSSIPPVA